jgi:hypothetical protein
MRENNDREKRQFIASQVLRDRICYIADALEEVQYIGFKRQGSACFEVQFEERKCS